jgi:folylpolyglutamate synthase/dihydropteroate synthase
VPVVAAQSPVDAVQIAEGIAGENGSVIVTGSLYLCGAVRERWYAGREIIEQKTQWPGTNPRPS